MSIAEDYKIVPILASEDISTGVDTDSIDMSGFHKGTFIFTCATVVTDIAFTPTSGIAAGTKTTAIPLRWAVGGAAIGTAVAGSTASCDVLSAWSAHASTAVTTASSDLMYVIEIDASAMTDGEPWLTFSLVTATSGFVHCVAILEPRYSSNRSGTALA